MRKHKRKIMNQVLCFAVIFSMLSQNGILTVLAEPDGQMKTEAVTESTDDSGGVTGTNTEITDVISEESSTSPDIISEIEENRGEFSKEYLLSDNSRAVVVYPQQIHYETDDGSMVEIDNSLINTEEGYENGNNSYEVVITDNEESQGEVVRGRNGSRRGNRDRRGN